MSYSVTPRFTALIRDDTAGDMDVELTWSIAGTAGTKWQVEIDEDEQTVVPIPSCALLIVIPPTDNTQDYGVHTTDPSGTAYTELSPSTPSVLAVKPGTSSVYIVLEAGTDQTFTFIAI